MTASRWEPRGSFHSLFLGDWSSWIASLPKPPIFDILLEWVTGLGAQAPSVAVESLLLIKRFGDLLFGGKLTLLYLYCVPKVLNYDENYYGPLMVAMLMCYTFEFYGLVDITLWTMILSCITWICSHCKCLDDLSKHMKLKYVFL